MIASLSTRKCTPGPPSRTSERPTMFGISMVISVLLLLAGTCRGLRDVRVSVPSAVRRGESAVLRCHYDIEGDSLYSVKWYKGRREFYRFTPKETPMMKIFPIAGLNVEAARSNESQLTLSAAERGVSGRYSCEVSADAPSFHTYLVSADLEVVETPRHRPVITGIRPRYKHGDVLRGNCTSKHSRPPANLTWQVNGKQPGAGHVKHYKPLRDVEGLETSITGIHFMVTHQHFMAGKLKIRCTASIHNIYWQSTEKSVEEEKQRVFAATAVPVGHNVNLLQPNGDDQLQSGSGEMGDQDESYMKPIKADLDATSSSSRGFTNLDFILTITTIIPLFHV